MKTTNKLDKTSIVIDSSLGENIELYKFSRIFDSNIGNKSSIGDFSKVEYSTLESHNRIDRYNYVSKSSIGRHSYTGMNSLIINSKIGKFCSISWRVTIGPANHNYSLPSTHSFLYNDFNKLKPLNYTGYDRFNEECIIGNDVWIGCNSTILRGVSIGDGAVVGAHSLVNKDVPPYSIVVGNPAKIIRFRFEQNIIDKMLDLKWWNWSNKKIRMNFEFFENPPTSETIKRIN